MPRSETLFDLLISNVSAIGLQYFNVDGTYLKAVNTMLTLAVPAARIAITLAFRIYGLVLV